MSKTRAKDGIEVHAMVDNFSFRADLERGGVFLIFPEPMQRMAGGLEGVFLDTTVMDAMQHHYEDALREEEDRLEEEYANDLDGDCGPGIQGKRDENGAFRCECGSSTFRCVPGGEACPNYYVCQDCGAEHTNID